MGRRSSIALWLSVPGLLAACALLSSTPQVTPGPPSSSSAGDLRAFDEGGLTFAYPSAWQELHFTVDSSFSHLIAVLATVPVPNPCATTVTASFTEIGCTAHFQLVPDSVVVQIQEGGMPGFDISHLPDGATPMTVDGQPAYVRDTSGPALTTDEPAVGADLVRTWTLSNPGALDNYFEIDAFIRGPNPGSIEKALASLVASLRYDPPATPTPTPAAASPGADAVTPPSPRSAPSLRPAPSTSPSIVCISDQTDANGQPLADECPAAIAAVDALVPRLGQSTVIRIDPGPFGCGDLWPGVGSPQVCFEPAIFPGLTMHGWVSFQGTSKVAAISLERSSLVRSSIGPSVGPPFGAWQASFAAFVVPPAGWMMP